MIRLILLILLVSGPPSVFAEDTVKQEQETTKGQAAEGQDKQDQIVWPQTFTPSQDVGADSQVSFPTDI